MTEMTGISMCGVTDLKAMDVESHLLERHYNKSLVEDDDLEERSPATHVHKIVSPITIVQGAWCYTGHEFDR